MKTLLAVIAVALFYVAPLHAEEKDTNYWGAQYALVTYDESGFDEAEPTALVLRLGRFVTENISIEGRLGFGLEDDEVDVGPFDVEIEVDKVYGIYGVFHTSGSDDTNVYGVLGFTKGELEATALGATFEGDDSGLSYGIGANFRGFNIEYMSYLDEDDYDVTAISLGYRRMFD
jgi:outer membrane immunogenic protein